MTARTPKPLADYGTFFALMVAMTVGEWALFLQRRELGLADDVVIPVLLSVSLVKLVLAVAWFSQNQTEIWPRKAVVATLVMVGGVAVALVHLLS